jgi:uncharacterized lipoprotein YajG
VAVFVLAALLLAGCAAPARTPTAGDPPPSTPGAPVVTLVAAGDVACGPDIE